MINLVNNHREILNVIWKSEILGMERGEVVRNIAYLPGKLEEDISPIESLLVQEALY